MYELATDFEKIYGDIDSLEQIENQFMEIITADLEKIEN